ncbi:MAG: glycosyltransferase family 39 protein [Elusimicrobia bacterium]|nr:glycosyltransferase family 39 protein [Elusimicrobiota bacterium]
MKIPLIENLKFKIRNYFLNYPKTALFLTALLIRVAAALIIGPGSGEEDGAYVNLANKVIAGQPYAVEQERGGPLLSWLPPGFCVVLVASFRLFGESLEPLRWMQILLSAVSCIAMLDIGRRLFRSDLLGFFCGWAMAIYPARVFWSTRVGSREIAFLLFVAALWLLARITIKENSAARLKENLGIFFVGLLWAFLSLTRGEFLTGILAIMGYFWINQQKPLLFTSLFLAGMALGFVPWVGRNWKIHHKIVITSTNYGDNFWFSFNPKYRFTGHEVPLTPELKKLVAGKTEIERAGILVQAGLDFIKNNPLRGLYIWTGNLIHFWRPYLSLDAVSISQNLIYMTGWLPLFTLFLLGLRRLPVMREPFWALIVGMIAIKWLGHSFFYVIVSFREAIVPLFILVGANAVRNFQNQWYLNESN